MKKLFCILCLCAMFAFISIRAFAEKERGGSTTYISQMLGDWNDPNSWSNGVPNETMTAIIANNCWITCYDAEAGVVIVESERFLMLDAVSRLMVTTLVELETDAGVVMFGLCLLDTPRIIGPGFISIDRGRLQTNVIMVTSISLADGYDDHLLIRQAAISGRE